MQLQSKYNNLGGQKYFLNSCGIFEMAKNKQFFKNKRVDLLPEIKIL